jgi:dimethylglycine dehydrogenase
MEAGAEFGIKPFGTRAMMSLAREKNFGSWSRDFRPIYSPFEAGLERFVDMGKNDFLGRAALAEEKAAGPKLARVAFTIDATDADCLGDEPVWLDGEVIGWITSGGYCHHAGQSFATGYVPRANAETSGRWEIEILGERRPATLASAPLFDPNGARMRG